MLEAELTNRSELLAILTKHSRKKERKYQSIK